MDKEHSGGQVAWGARFHALVRYDAGDCLAWAKPPNRDRWVQQGLVLGDLDRAASAKKIEQVCEGEQSRTSSEPRSTWPAPGTTAAQP